MGRLYALVSLLVLCGAAAAVEQLNPRGPRPVEPATRSDDCAPQKTWPFCTDDDWGSKCPSGCRIQGLMDQADHDFQKRIETIRNILDQYTARFRNTDVVSKQTYDFLREKLVVDSGKDNNYYDLAQNLRRRISDLKIKIDRQLRTMEAMKDRVRDQVVEMQRLEVDIDIKLRACKGSCSSYATYHVDQDSYMELEKQVNQLSAQAAQSVETVGTMYVMKSRPLQGVLVDSIYKSGSTKTAEQQKTDVFSEVNQVNLVLEEEGSRASPATISKDTGTSFSSSSSHSTHSITELGQPGDGSLFSGGFDNFGQPSTSSHMTTSTSTSTITCYKTIKRTVVHTKDGPVEKMEEVIEGGPECQSAGDTLFSDPSHTSSSTSSITKTTYSDGTKGSLTTDSITGLDNPFGFDFGGFKADDPEDDIPDFHARSVKSGRVERQANYVGKGTQPSDVE